MKTLGAKKRETLWAVAQRIVPGAAKLDGEQREEMEAIIDRALADRPAGLRKQFGIFLTLIRWSPVARYGRPFPRLSAAQQDAVLGWLQDSAPGKLKVGFWGLKSMVFMGYYGRKAAWAEVGYAPTFDGGNDALDRAT